MFGGASPDVVSTLIDSGADVDQPLQVPMLSIPALVFGFLALKNRWNQTAVPWMKLDPKRGGFCHGDTDSTHGACPVETSISTTEEKNHGI